jgi:hypothetical protein
MIPFIGFTLIMSGIGLMIYVVQQIRKDEKDRNNESDRLLDT